MKICHITSAHATNDVRIFEKECVSLAKEKNNNVYLVGPGKSQDLKNVKIIGIGDKPANRIGRFTSYTRKAIDCAMKINADIYHLHDPELIRFAKKLKKTGASIIFDSHENYVKQIACKEYLRPHVRKIASSIYKLFEDCACKYFDCVIFPCPINGKHPFEGRVENTVFINNVPLLTENCTEKDIVQNRSKETVVCCVGSLTRNRGIEQLVDACFNSNVKLILAGNFQPENFYDDLTQKEAFQCVEYRGFCSRTEVMKIYSESDFGASNLLDVGQYREAENLPTKVYEYMMNGLPVIVSNFLYSVKMIEGYECGICVNPNDSEEIARAIRYLSENNEKAKKMGFNGRKLIEEKFNWKIEEKKLFEIYSKIRPAK